jgi:hypothetical protein
MDHLAIWNFRTPLGIKNKYLISIFLKKAYKNSLNNTFINGKNYSQKVNHEKHYVEVSVLNLGDIKKTQETKETSGNIFNPFFCGRHITSFMCPFVFLMRYRLLSDESRDTCGGHRAKWNEYLPFP